MSYEMGNLYVKKQQNNLTKLYKNPTNTYEEPLWIIVVSVGLITIALENSGRKYGVEWVRLSVWLCRIYQLLQPLFLYAGRLYANVMGYLVLIDFDDILITINDIAHPVLQITILPFKALVEIQRQAELTSSIYHVFAGTVLAVVLVGVNLIWGMWYRITLLVDIIVSFLVCMRILWLIFDKEKNGMEEDDSIEENNDIEENDTSFTCQSNRRSARFKVYQKK